MRKLKKDSTIEVEVYQIDDYKTSPRQYEMHHLNSDVKISSTMQKKNSGKETIYSAEPGGQSLSD